jgi:glycosyltransferase involved in cell wall biosynthesis
MPEVTFLVPNVGGPSLGFATAYARTLSDRYPVQVVGPDIWGAGVMPIYRGSFDYTVVPTPRLYRFPDFLWQSERLRRRATGDVIFAVKAVPQTVWVALREKRRRGCKVVVCLDEWDGAMMARRTLAQRRDYWRRHWMHPINENYYPFVERMLPQADMIVSTSSFLQNKFGGMIVRMGVDTERFRPLATNARQTVRAEIGLTDEHRVVVFGGVVRPHKGVERILEAFRRIGDPRLRLLVVGPETDALRGMMCGPAGRWILFAGPQPAADMPRWLGAGDFSVLPMSDDLLAQSQVPCKVFEAMAMGLPVLAGAVSDLPDIVQGAGDVFPPEDQEALELLLGNWLSEPDKVARFGNQARQKCLDQFSVQIMQKELTGLVDRLFQPS